MFVVPNPLVVGRKFRSHADEHQNICTLATLSEEKLESEQRAVPLRIMRNKPAVAEGLASITAVVIAKVGPSVARAAGFMCEETRQHHEG
jgi:hypothetical protein